MCEISEANKQRKLEIWNIFKKSQDFIDWRPTFNLVVFLVRQVK